MGKSVWSMFVLVFCASTFNGSVQAGDNFYILNNGGPGEDGLYCSNTSNIPSDIMVHAYEDLFWADLSLGDQPGYLFGVQTGNDPAIVRIRESDGQIVATIPTDQQMRSIGYDPYREILYGFNLTQDDGRLFTIDLITGITTNIGDTGIPAVTSSLAYDPSRDMLYTNNDTDLYAINPLNASATLIGSLDSDTIYDLAWNPYDTLLYGTDADTDSLYLIDRDTAATSLVGGPYTNATFGTGLAFSNPIPEPGSWTLLLVGGWVIRKRRKK